MMKRHDCCGVLEGTPHLANCGKVRRPGGVQWRKPTPRMLDLVRNLHRELKKEDDIDVVALTFEQCRTLIDQLLAEKEDGPND